MNGSLPDANRLVPALQAAADDVAARVGPRPLRAAMILGSGWCDVTPSADVQLDLPYHDLPLMGRTGVEGHAGRMQVLRLRDAEFLVFHGRRHWYEGEGWGPVALPVYVCRAAKIPALLLTNACGGIRENLSPGDLMTVSDHINAMGVTPLIDAYAPTLGAHFPDMSEVYDAGLRDLLDACASRRGLRLRHGVYLATSGPSYETPAEVNAFRMLGADAVGMSTVPEALLGHALGLRVAAVSCVCNRAAGSGRRLTHEDVLAGATRARPRMQALLGAFCEALAAAPAAP